METDIYSVIMYRENGSDYCRSCLMGTSPSDFHIETSVSKERAIELVVKYLVESYDKRQDREYCTPEIHVLLEGSEFITYDSGHNMNKWGDYDSEGYKEFHEEVEKKFNDKTGALDAEIARKLQEKIIKEQNEKVQYDLALLDSLRKQYGV